MSLATMHAQKLRDTWQARALAETKGRLAAVVLGVLFHNFAEVMPILLRVVFPGFRDIKRPFLSGGATVLANGMVACGLVSSGSDAPRQMIIYEREACIVKDFRDLADRLKLNDADRVEMMGAIKKWVVADHCIDHLGRRLAS